MPRLRLHIKIALFFFIIFTFLELVIQFSQHQNLQLHSPQFQENSKLLLLYGWVYLSLISILTHNFIRKAKALRQYRYLFFSTLVSIIALSFTFLFSGKRLITYIFLFFLMSNSIWFYFFFKYNHSIHFKKSRAKPFFEFALFFLVVSSGFLFLLPFLHLLSVSDNIYKICRKLYFHFYFNGWIILAIIGLYIHLSEICLVNFKQKRVYQSLLIFFIGIILSSCLSLIEFEISIAFNYIGLVGAFLQFVGFTILLTHIENNNHLKVKITASNRSLLFVFIFLFYAKMYLQIISSIPRFSELVSQYQILYNGYYYLLILGVSSMAIFQFLMQWKLFIISTRKIWLYFIGFCMSELVFLVYGIYVTASPHSNTVYFILLFTSYSIMLITLVWMFTINISSSNFISFIRPSKNNIEN